MHAGLLTNEVDENRHDAPQAVSVGSIPAGTRPRQRRRAGQGAGKTSTLLCVPKALVCLVHARAAVLQTALEQHSSSTQRHT